MTEEEIQTKLRQEYRGQREESAKRRIPAEFLSKLDRSRKSVDWKAVDEILSWDEKRGITARGPSQLGKTRSIYAALHKAYVERGISFIVLDEWRVLAKVKDASRERDLEALGDKWRSVDVLWFDDLDKVNFTQGVTGSDALGLVFGVIKTRMANHKPTILSYNCRLSDIFGPAGQHYAASIAERVQQPEHWLNVEFKQP